MPRGSRLCVFAQLTVLNLDQLYVGLSYHGSRKIIIARTICFKKSIPLQKIERQCHTICHNGNRRVPHGTITMAGGIS